MLDLTVRTVCRRTLLIVFGSIFLLGVIVPLGALIGIVDFAVNFYRDAWRPMWRKA